MVAETRHILRILSGRFVPIALVLLLGLMMSSPARADTTTWPWEDGDCLGEPGKILSTQTVTVESNTEVCVTPPSYLLEQPGGSTLVVYVGVYINGQYYGETSVEDDIPRCTTISTTTVTVASSTLCTRLPVNADGTISYAAPAPTLCDCTSCATCTEQLNSPGCDIVRLTADIVDHAGDCIDNPDGFAGKIFDCDGHTIDGDWTPFGYAFYLYAKSGNTIQNCVISQFDTGIYLAEFCSGNTVVSNDISRNGMGIEIHGNLNANNAITNNTINENVTGIRVVAADLSNIVGNTMLDNVSYGVFLDSYANNNNLSHNVICSYRGVDIQDDGSNSETALDDHNTCDDASGWNDASAVWGCEFGCPVPNCGCVGAVTGQIYRCGDSVPESCTMDCDITSDKFDCFEIAADDVVIDCAGHSLTAYDTATQSPAITANGFNYGVDRVEVRNCRINNFGNGVSLTLSNDSTIADNWFSGCSYGASILYCGNTLLTGNTAQAGTYGMFLNNCGGSQITDNLIEGFSAEGVRLHITAGAAVTGNQVNDNAFGIRIQSGSGNLVSGNTAEGNADYGYYLIYTSGNTLSENLATGNRYGIGLYYNANDNELHGNTVQASGDAGMLVDSSGGNLVYDNLFNNVVNITFSGTILSNAWNTTRTPGSNIVGGPELGGNYWATPSGTGFSETCLDADFDGFCDTPYVLATNNSDELPLTQPEEPNTPVGDDVLVADEETGVSVTFSAVTEEGMTVVTTGEEGPDPPAGFELLTDPPIYFDITCSAGYEGGVTVCIEYDEGAVDGPEEDLELMHWNEISASWEIITDPGYPDVAANVICGTTPGFSLFAIMEPVAELQAEVDFDPDTLNLGSNGKVVTVYMSLPEGYSVTEIDITSLLLNGTVAAMEKPVDILGPDADGLQRLMVKFSLSAVTSILEVGDDVPVTITGSLFDGTQFAGTDLIRCIQF